MTDAVEKTFVHPNFEDLPAYGLLKPIFDKVCEQYRMTFVGLLDGRTPLPLEARQVCCWLANKLQLRLTYTEIADVLGRSRNTAERAVEAIERQRVEDAWLREVTDRLLAELRA